MSLSINSGQTSHIVGGGDLISGKPITEFPESPSKIAGTTKLEEVAQLMSDFKKAFEGVDSPLRKRA